MRCALRTVRVTANVSEHSGHLPKVRHKSRIKDLLCPRERLEPEGYLAIWF